MKDMLVFVALTMGGILGIGLFNFARLSKANRKEWLSFHCGYPDKWYWPLLFPIVATNFGFLTILFWRNIEKE